MTPIRLALMVGYALLVALVFRLSPTPDPPTDPPVARTVAVDRGPRADDLFEQVLAYNRVREPELDETALRTAFEGAVARARQAVRGAETPRAIVAGLNRALLIEPALRYRSNEYWRDATLAGALLRAQANCAATSTLYVVVADRLGLPVKMVSSPGHAFVRWDDGTTRINIETTAHGRCLPDAHYLHELGPQDPARVAWEGWCRSMTVEEFLAEQILWAADHLASQDRDREALALLDRADALVPGRSDRHLKRLRLETRLSGDRKAYLRRLEALLDEPDRPVGLKAGLLMRLAGEHAGRGDHRKEAHLLRLAFRLGDKESQQDVLQQLAFAYRAQRDFAGAVRIMELSVMLESPQSPRMADSLYNLAIMQKNAGRLGQALSSIARARTINPEGWGLQCIQAGYRVMQGDRDGGRKQFEALKPPRTGAGFVRIMTAWFWAVYGDRERFYPAFGHALEAARDPGILEWIDQDTDLDPYRRDPRFIRLLDRHAPRLLGTLDNAREP